MNLQRGMWLVSKVAHYLMLGLLVSWLGAQVNETTPLVGYPEDWTHHRIKFTLQGLREHAEIASREPRAIHQLYRQWRAYQSPVVTASVSAPESTVAALETAAPANHPDWNVSLGGGTIAFGQFPAKWNLNIRSAPSCTGDYVVFALNVPGAAGGQANLVGFSNLYSGTTGSPLCAGGGPTVKFAYATNFQANGLNRTSPVLSLDGTKIAFVESHAAQGPNGAKSYLHILTIGTTGNNGTSVTAAVTPGVGNNAVNVSILYANAITTRSSPWVDYPTDTLYVSSDDGRLNKITGVFKGTPTLVMGGGWPISVNANGIMTGPAFDNTTGNGVMFMGDNSGNLYAVQNISTTPGPVHTLAVGTGGAGANAGIFDAPIFEAGGGRVYAFSAHGTDDFGVLGAVVVLAHDTTFSLNANRKINIGAGATAPGGGGIPIYSGDFDNNYFVSSGTGHMLVCGTGPSNAFPYRYNLPIVAGSPQVDNAPVALTNNTLTSRCGPVTENFNPNINGGTDFLMWGVTSNCRITGSSTSGCVISFQNGTTTVKATASGGTSGIIIDNEAFTGDPGGQTSNLYFATQSGTLSAVKRTQLGLN